MSRSKGFIPKHLGNPVIQSPEPRVFSPEELALLKEETDIAVKHGHPPGKKHGKK